MNSIVSALLLCFVLLLQHSSSVYATAATASFSFDAKAPLFTVKDTYLSFNIDAGSLFNEFDFTDTAFRNLVKTLAKAAPTQIRIGGSAADDTVYTGPDGARGNCSTANATVICLNQQYWDEINDFVAFTGVHLVFDINIRHRKNNNQEWDPSNAALLLNYTQQMGYPIAAWQLGNEIELFGKHGKNLCFGFACARILFGNCVDYCES